MEERIEGGIVEMRDRRIWGALLAGLFPLLAAGVLAWRWWQGRKP